jgi:hypothetical protein
MTVAPTTGVYAVRYAPVGEDETRTLEDSARVVARGQPLGFDVADDGSLLAVAGGEQFLLPLRRDDLRKCVWYCRTERSTQFAREVGKVGQGAVVVAAGAGIVAGVGAAGVGVLALDRALDGALLRGDDCEDEDFPRRHRHHHHHHHHRSDSVRSPSTQPATAPPGGAP